MGASDAGMMLLRLALKLLRHAASRALRHAAVTAGLWGLAMLSFLLGGGGLIAALWIAVARVLDPLSAALIIGAVGFAGGIILLLVVRARRAEAFFPPSVAAEFGSVLGDKTAGFPLWATMLALALLGFALSGKEKPDEPDT